MLDKMIILLGVPHPEIFFVLLLLSFCIETASLLTLSMHRSSIKQFLLLFWNSSARVIQRFAIYFALVVLGNIMATYLKFRMSVEAFVYLVEVITMLKLSRDTLKDVVIRDAIDNVLQLIAKSTNIRVSEPDKLPAKTDIPKEESPNDKELC
ncbi:hypothetical protein [Acinetobacter sp.]|uniref:hypothetical protein n=1 Tax=Acinetobacter sp. TaxID=472 RepID=UPI003D069419